LQAEKYLETQHSSCHYGWKTYITDNEGREIDRYADEDNIYDLLDNLGTIARRDVLQMSFVINEHPNENKKTEMIQVFPLYIRG
jgi:macrodomain Ter protein organizer (MatP/YcbG family)